MTVAYTPKYEPFSASRFGGRPKMLAVRSGKATRASRSGTTPSTSTGAFRNVAPSSSSSVTTSEGTSARVDGHRIVGSFTRTSTSSPTCRHRPHHESSSNACKVPSPASSTTRFARNRFANDASDSLSSMSFLSSFSFLLPIFFHAASRLGVALMCRTCSPGLPPTLANECPLANVSFGGFEGSPEAVSRNVEKKRSTGSRSLLTRTSKQVARTLPGGLLPGRTICTPRSPTRFADIFASEGSVMSWWNRCLFEW